VAEKGDPIPWVLRGIESVDGNCCWSRNRFWVIDCGDWTSNRAKPPCGLIASTWGWLAIDIWNNKTMDGRNVLLNFSISISNN
jgi:hypothetical protein